MVTTTLRKLNKAEWDDVRSLATTVTQYDPSASIIKGKTTIQILQEVTEHQRQSNHAQAQALVELLILREAYNAFIGMESKKRRRN